MFRSLNTNSFKTKLLKKFCSIYSWIFKNPLRYNKIQTGNIISLIKYYILKVVIIITYLPTHLLGQDMTQGQFLSGV